MADNNTNAQAATPTYGTSQFITKVIYHTDKEPKDVDLLWDNNNALKYFNKEWLPFENLLQRASVTQDGLMTSAQVAALGQSVSWTSIPTNDLPKRKAIVLNNHDTILAYGEKEGEGTYSILMLNKWGVVDLGTPKKPINLNTPKGVRPTVQEDGQTGAQAYKVAYTLDIDNLSTALTVKVDGINTTLSKSITDEATRATTAENTLNTAIQDVATNLTKTIGDEETRASKAESTLDQKIDNTRPTVLDTDEYLSYNDQSYKIGSNIKFERSEPWHYIVKGKDSKQVADIDLTGDYKNLNQSVKAKTEVTWIIFKNTQAEVPNVGEHLDANYYVKGSSSLKHWDAANQKFDDLPLNASGIYLEEWTKFPYYNIDDTLESPLADLSAKVTELQNKVANMGK